MSFFAMNAAFMQSAALNHAQSPPGYFKFFAAAIRPSCDALNCDEEGVAWAGPRRHRVTVA